MHRFTKNRRWTFILTVFALFLSTALYVSSASAELSREGAKTSDPSLGGGAPPPNGAGDPDTPIPTSLKYQQRGSLRTGGATLSTPIAGDNRYEGNVWMWRLSVMGRVLQAYWIRL